jgi:hypothetical protein
MNSSNQLAVHQIYRFESALRHKFIMYGTFSSQNAVKFYSRLISAFSLSEPSVPLDSTKLHSDVSFLDRAWNTKFHRPFTVIF